MAGFQGADTEALRAMAQLITRRANLVDDLRGHLTLLIEDIAWVGEDADRFRAEWAGVVRPGLQDLYLDLRYKARALLSHAEEQDGASSVDSVGPSGSAGGQCPPGPVTRRTVRRPVDAPSLVAGRF